MTDHYHNIQSSLLKFIHDFAVSKGIASVNLDAHVDEAQWPSGDFIGMGEFNVEMTELYSGQVMFGMSTLEDVNLHRMGSLIQDLVPLVKPNENIQVYDAVTGDAVGELYILQGTKIGSPMPTKTQAIQPVFIRFESNLRVY